MARYFNFVYVVRRTTKNLKYPNVEEFRAVLTHVRKADEQRRRILSTCDIIGRKDYCDRIVGALQRD